MYLSMQYANILFLLNVIISQIYNRLSFVNFSAVDMQSEQVEIECGWVYSKMNLIFATIMNKRDSSKVSHGSFKSLPFF